MHSQPEMFDEFIIRPPTRADIPAIVDMTNADALQYLGAPDLTVAEYEAEWAEVGIDKAEMTRIATTKQGEVVAMVEAHCHHLMSVIFSGDGCILPMVDVGWALI